jgi:uncharacterized protein (TIGR03435 family)
VGWNVICTEFDSRFFYLLLNVHRPSRWFIDCLGLVTIMFEITVRSTALMAIMLLSTALPIGAVRSEYFVQQDTLMNQKPTFDVASVRPSDPDSTGFSGRPKPDDFSMKGATLKFLVQYAYDIHDFQVEGAPKWTESAKFDVQGKMDQPAGGTLNRQAANRLAQLRVQNLLKERFKLRVHPSTKELPVFGLVMTKGGPKLQAATKNEGYSMAAGMYKCSYASMSDLAWMLSGSLNRIVDDETNLSGPFAFTLKWTPDEVTNPDATTPGLFTAIQEQLGLRLLPQKRPVPVVVVDSVDRPSNN